MKNILILIFFGVVVFLEVRNKKMKDYGVKEVGLIILTIIIAIGFIRAFSS
jgi:hypothetical protein